MTRTVVVLPGDGSGPELVRAARRVLDASGADLRWEVHEVGATAEEPLGEAALAAVRRAGVALKGPVATPPGTRSVNLRLRRELDLYVQVRPARTRPGVAGAYPEVDLVVARETTEDLYAGVELPAGDPDTERVLALLRARGADLAEGSALAVKPTSATASARAARAAARWAADHGIDRLTVVHKAAVMPATDGLFLEAATSAAADEAPGLHVDAMSVDAAAAALVRRPGRFGLLLMPNLYGDVLSDLAGALVGGLGLAPGANLGDDGRAVFEAVHGTVPRQAGRGTADPLALVLSGAMLLRHVGEVAAADRVERAVDALLADGSVLPRDLVPDGRPAAGTDEVADALVGLLAQA